MRLMKAAERSEEVSDRSGHEEHREQAGQWLPEKGHKDVVNFSREFVLSSHFTFRHHWV